MDYRYKTDFVPLSQFFDNSRCLKILSVKYTELVLFLLFVCPVFSRIFRKQILLFLTKLSLRLTGFICNLARMLLNIKSLQTPMVE